MLNWVDKLKIGGIIVVLSFLFSPGLILTLPPKKITQAGLFGMGVLNSKETRVLAMFVHSILIALLFVLIITFVPFISSIFNNSGGGGGDSATEDPVADDSADSVDAGN